MIVKSPAPVAAGLLVLISFTCPAGAQDRRTGNVRPARYPRVRL